MSKSIRFERHHLLYPKKEWSKDENAKKLREKLIYSIEHRPHGSVHTMVRSIKIPTDIEELAKISTDSFKKEVKPSTMCEWLARMTRDEETRKDLLAEAYILSIEGL